MILRAYRSGGPIILALLCAVPAAATETIHCGALDDSDVYVEMNLGMAAVERPSWVRIGTGSELWSSLDQDRAEDPETVPVTIAQSFFDARGMAVDVADENVIDLVASLRVFRIEEDDMIHQYGWLHLPGRSVHPVSCDGP